MDKGDQYLSTDTKSKFIGDSLAEIYGGDCNIPPWLDVLQKIAWLDEMNRLVG